MHICRDHNSGITHLACVAAVAAVSTSHGVEKLRWSKYSVAYQRRLLESGQALQCYLKKTGMRGSLIQTGKAMHVDECLVQFIRELHGGKSRSGLRVAKHAVLLIQFLRPRLRRKLQGAREALKAREEKSPSRFRPPVPLPILICLVCKARLLAEKALSDRDKKLWMIFSALALVGFFGLLRPGELLNLRSADVVLPNSLALAGEFAVVRIVRPKNARQMGSQQYVEIRHPDAINWLSWLKCQAPKPESTLWPSTATKFRVLFKHICSSLQLETLRLSPASLRAGGATWLVDEGVEISRIRFLGRWAHMRSLEHYIQVARAQQIALTIQPQVASRLRAFLTKFFFLLNLPQFLAAQVPEVHLLASVEISTFGALDAIPASRRWGRAAQAISEDRSFSGTAQRSTIH